MGRLAVATGKDVVAVLETEPFFASTGSGPAEDVTLKAAWELYRGLDSLEWTSDDGWLAVRPSDARYWEFSRPVATKMLAVRDDEWPSLETVAGWAAESGDEGIFLQTSMIALLASPLNRRLTLLMDFWLAEAYAGLSVQPQWEARRADGVVLGWQSLPPAVAATIREAIYGISLPMRPPSSSEATGSEYALPADACESDYEPTRVAPMGIPPTARVWIRRGSEPALYRVNANARAPFAESTSLEHLAEERASAEASGTGSRFQERLQQARFFDGTSHWVEIEVVGEGWIVGPHRWVHGDGSPGKALRGFSDFTAAERAEFQRHYEAALRRIKDK